MSASRGVAAAARPLTWRARAAFAPRGIWASAGDVGAPAAPRARAGPHALQAWGGANVPWGAGGAPGAAGRDLIAGGARGFFGGGDSQAFVHEERRLIKFSAEELFDIVSDVQSYDEFLPWCDQSTVHQRSEDGKELRAELKVGFRGLAEVYTSRVLLNRPRSIEVESVDSVLFEQLRSVWSLQSGPQPGTCWLQFQVQFKFRSPLYNSVAGMFLEEVVKKMIAAFEKRCATAREKKEKEAVLGAVAR